MKRIDRSRNQRSVLLSVALSAALMCTALPTAYADGGAAPVAAAASLGRVDLSGSSFVEVKRVNMLADQNGRIVTFTLSVTNNDTKDISFVDYWVRLMTKSGAQFTVKLMPQDKDKNTIPAGSTKELSFYSTVNEGTSLTDLKIRVIKWDFSVDSFERTLGEVEVPANFTNVAAAGAALETKLAGTNTKLTVSKFTLGKNEKYSLPAITLVLENADAHSLTVPAYQFAVRAQDGSMYPLEAKGLKDLVVTPQDKKEVTLSGNVPVSVPTDNWQLVITENVTDLKRNIPVAAFQLPAVAIQDGAEAGKEVQFTDEHGLYTAKLNGIYRLPWEDQDIISADMLIANKGTSDSLPIPQLSGYFLLDGAVKVEAKVITPAKVLGLSNGAAVGMQMAAKIPYTYEFSKVKLVLQEKTTDEKTVDVLEFETPAEVMNVPIAEATSTYQLEDTGYRSQFSIDNVKTYEGKSTELLAAQVVVENKEKRFANIAKLLAHFRTADGTVYPATVAEVKDKVGPGEKALLTVYSILPKGVDKSGMNVLLGEAVTDGKLGSDGDKGTGSTDTGTGTSAAAAGADMYIKPFSFWLPQENKDVKTPLQDIKLGPYTMSISKVGTTMDIEKGQLDLKFDYEITKDLTKHVNVDGRKLVFELNDTNGLRVIEWSTEMNKFEPQASDTPATPQSSLRVGKYKEFKINLYNGDLLWKLSFLKQYDLNLYEEFQGHRRLIATMKNTWFALSD
ncbi:hypothetical protein ACFFK0_11620 [Paenibacillus chartarius]|uniref:Uncharacterized protein n=1 Tax=Paenibacillus chartarius TaxID=747481 RepID=A0ABV6DKE3_9BACL